MKKSITLILAIAISSLHLPALQAQPINQERMNRDINIMESILGELFKTRWEADGNRIRISSGSFAFGGSSQINGTYIRDYGVIFTIPARTTGFVISTDGDRSSYHFQYGDDNKQVTRANVTDRIITFLQDYGATLGQLDADDRLTVIYESPRGRSAVQVFADGEAEVEKNDPVPTIHVSARMQDLDAFRRGTLDHDRLVDRLTITTHDKNTTDYRDLRIMSDILETSFNDAEAGEFEVNNIRHAYLDDLGALFTGKASYNGGLFGVFAEIGEAFSGSISIDSLSLQASAKAKADDPGHRGERLKKLREDQEAAYKMFLSQLKETMIDYGRTLKSVQADEIVLLSLSVSSSGGSVPDHIDLQVPKSVLDRYDRGKISRDQAIRQISVREY